MEILSKFDSQLPQKRDSRQEDPRLAMIGDIMDLVEEEEVDIMVVTGIDELLLVIIVILHLAEVLVEALVEAPVGVLTGVEAHLVVNCLTVIYQLEMFLQDPKLQKKLPHHQNLTKGVLIPLTLLMQTRDKKCKFVWIE